MRYLKIEVDEGLFKKNSKEFNGDKELAKDRIEISLNFVKFFSESVKS